MDYSKLNKEQLLKEVNKRKLSIAKSAKKDDIIALLKKDDRAKKAAAKKAEAAKTAEAEKAPAKKPVADKEESKQEEVKKEVKVAAPTTRGVVNGGPVVDGEIYVRGTKHSTFVAFLVVIGSSMIMGLVTFISFFYWPLIRKWFNFLAEYYWGWIITLQKFFAWIGLIILIIATIGAFMTSMSVGVTMLIVLLLYGGLIWSIIKGLRVARQSRAYYKENIYK